MTSETAVAIAAIVSTILMAIVSGYVGSIRAQAVRAEADLKAADARHDKAIESMATRYESATNDCAVEIKGLQNRLRENDLETERLKGRCNATDAALVRLQADVARVLYRRESDPKQPASGGR